MSFYVLRLLHVPNYADDSILRQKEKGRHALWHRGRIALDGILGATSVICPGWICELPHHKWLAV